MKKITLLIILLVTTSLCFSQNTWTVNVQCPGFGDEVSWLLRDASNSVILSGGPYSSGSNNTHTVSTSNEPLSFYIETFGTWSDNTAIFNISCGTNSYPGTITGGTSTTLPNLVCGVSPPTAVCQDYTAELDINGDVTITGANVDGGSSDPDGDPITLSVSPDTFDCSHVGTPQTVTLTVDDGNGGIDTCTANVTIVDNLPPTISCPTDIIQGNDPSICGAVVTFTEPVATDNCNSGGTPNILFVSDDAIASEIETVLLNEGYIVTAVYNDFSAGDNTTLQGSLTAYNLIYWHASGATGYGEVHNASTFTNLNSFVAGGGNVFVTGYDVVASPDDDDMIAFLGGSSSTDASRSNGTLIGPNNLTTGFSNTVGMTINAPINDQDNINGLASSVIIVLPGSSSGGAEWSINDVTGGEIAWVSSGQSIINPSFPSWTTPGSGYHEALLNFAFNSSGSGTSIVQTTGLPSGSIFPVGTTTNTFEATDAAGNTATCSFDVTVNDSEVPEITCPTDIIQANDPGECGAVVTFTEPVATDNCSTYQSLTNTMPNHSSSYSGDSRGYWFTAPVDFTITSLRVPTFASSGDQSIMVMRFAAPPATWSGTSSYDSLLFYTGLDSNSGFITVNIPILAGEVIGLLGVRGTNGSNSYTSDTSISIDGNPVTIERFGTQNNIANGPAPQGSFWTESGGYKSNIDFEYEIGSGTLSVTQTVGLASGDVFPIGTTTNSFEVTDNAGNTSTCSFDVTIEDNEFPIIGCPGDVTAYTEDGDCGAIVNFQNAVGLDNCGSVTVYQTEGLGSGSVFPVGDTLIEFTAQDENGNLSTCNFTVTVEDDDAPEAICQSITVQLDENGDASITANQVNFGSNDNCGVDTLEIDIDTFDCSDVGDNDVVLTVTDVNGNQSTCTAVVTVEDVTAPVVACQDIIVELGADGTVTIDPMDVDAGSSDACGIATYELNIDTFDCLNVGDSTVILTVTDVNGNESSCTTTVTVEDNIAPELVCMDVTLELNEDGIAYIIPSQLVETINDPCGVLVFTADVDELYCSDIGTPVEVNIFANDGNGNSSFCSSMVTVVDVLGPQIVCPENEQVNLDPDGTYTLGDYIGDGIATVSDNCTGPVTIFSQSPAAGTTLGFGVHTITFTAEDEYGNVSTCSFELDVEEILGANDAEDFASLVLYPNPADSQVNLSNPRQMDLSEVTIYDLTGRIVKVVDLTNMGSEITIDVSHLANATYLAIINGSQGVITKQLIVSNY